MLITLEGIDGSGKTMTAEALRGAFPDATFTREPTESWYGDAVRRSIDDEDADPVAELFLSTADHADHLARTIRPALERGDLVISDGYVDSRYAYRAASLEGIVDDPLMYVRAIHDPWSRPPDATLYLDVDAETGAARSGATDATERAAFLDRVRGNYEVLLGAERERFVRIDAGGAPEDVIADAEASIERLVE